ncbi:hypothetical protein HJG60_009695 [Phyllostomus discolor]|uniref:Uncharacterized protein n=1 Tax=Phyllostomus discolor TaxID=89673 RepID=A0A834EL83_9CHIR|nr:hypothetical protein HJG60_009695 [Phyllostomus discolor]
MWKAFYLIHKRLVMLKKRRNPSSLGRLSETRDPSIPLAFGGRRDAPSSSSQGGKRKCVRMQTCATATANPQGLWSNGFCFSVSPLRPRSNPPTALFLSRGEAFMKPDQSSEGVGKRQPGISASPSTGPSLSRQSPQSLCYGDPAKRTRWSLCSSS